MSFGTSAVGLLLVLASVWDVRYRRVPVWLTLGSLSLGLLVSVTRGASSLEQGAIGVVVGGLLFVPFVLRGGFGLADALILGAVGAWSNWQFVLSAAFWAALAGAGIALVVWFRGRRSFPYVPAIALGTVIAALSSLG